jgi:hypothetical protein
MVCRGQAGLFGDLSDAHRLVPQHGAHLDELLAGEARLPTEVGPVATLLSVLDTSPLCGLGRLSLGLRGRGHEGDQRIADGSLHRITGRPIEGEIVDHRADHHASPHKLADRVAHILVVPAEAIDPTDYKHVTGSQLVEQPATLGTLDKPTVET